MSESTKINQFDTIPGPEIFIGLVGPLGTDLSIVVDELKTLFLRFGYETIIIKLSESINEIKDRLTTPLELSPEDKRISSYMDAGTEFRTKSGWGGVLAIMAAAKIRGYREDPKKPRYRTLYIFDSIKHKKETEVLRNIYGHGYFQISVYSSEEKRTRALVEKLATSHCNSFDTTQYTSIARDLIKKDHDERSSSLGQNVSGAFPLADFFVNIDLRHLYKNNIERFVDLLFGNPFITPTKDEAGMFYARTAALRSSDLSRQVGAAITNGNGDIINIGCNEVPKAGGSVFWEGDNKEEDFRDFSVGFDINTKKKEELLVQTIKLLQDVGVVTIGSFENQVGKLVDAIFPQSQEAAQKEETLDAINHVLRATGQPELALDSIDNKEEFKNKLVERITSSYQNAANRMVAFLQDVQKPEAGLPDDNQLKMYKSFKIEETSPIQIANSLLYGEHSSKFKESQIANILEYGRVVHAEMHAITDSAKRGLSVDGAILYCTTFPCHMCARHIISSGIMRVVYIEPYPKSLAEGLYENEISVDSNDDKKVNFEAFMGIAPLSYAKLFNYKKRKEKDGKKVKWPAEIQDPIVVRYVPSYIMVEENIIKNLYKKLTETGLRGSRTKEEEVKNN